MLNSRTTATTEMPIECRMVVLRHGADIERPLSSVPIPAISIGSSDGSRSDVASAVGRSVTAPSGGLADLSIRDSRQACSWPAQGHSKNPPGHGRDGRRGIDGEGFAGSRHRDAAAAQQGEDEIAQGHHGPCAGADTGAILVHRDVAPPMQPILDAPVGAHEGEQPLRAGLGGGQARHEIGDLGRGLAGFLAHALDAHHLGRTGPLQMRNHLAADLRLAALDAAVALVEGLGTRDVRRQGDGAAAVGRGGKDRRSSRRWRHAARVGSF